MPKILVIDDEDNMRFSLERVLSIAGFEVSSASDGNEGLAKFRASPADLVITDIFMPNMEGIETIVALRKEFPDLPIVAISGNPTAQTVLSVAGAVGATVLLPKPFHSDELLKAVTEALRPKPK